MLRYSLALLVTLPCAATAFALELFRRVFILKRSRPTAPRSTCEVGGSGPAS